MQNEQFSKMNQLLQIFAESLLKLYQKHQLDYFSLWLIRKDL